MKTDFGLSVVLHLFVVITMLVSSPFENGEQEFGEVIRVSLTALPAMPSTELLPPIQIPQALETEPVEIPLEEPATAPSIVIDEQEEPEKKPKDKTYQPKVEPGKGNRAGGQEGSTEVETGGGTPFTGATIDNATFDYPYWFTQAFYKIQLNWRNPVAADYSIVCVVYFQVIKSGRVIELGIEETSGIRTYDEACLRAIERSAPFPPLPGDFRDEIIGITLPFKYEP